MLIKLGQATDHGFKEPLGLLSDCHRRIERFLHALVTVAEQSRGAQLTREDRHVLESALTYFATAAPRHTADEEASLFPRLRACRDRRAQAAMDSVHRLESEHRDAETHHADVDALGRRWLADGRLDDADVETLVDHLHALQRLYGAHIKVEDEQLFPIAADLLRPDELEAMGREMAERRGVPFDPPKGL